MIIVILTSIIFSAINIAWNNIKELNITCTIDLHSNWEFQPVHDSTIEAFTTVLSELDAYSNEPDVFGGRITFNFNHEIIPPHISLMSVLDLIPDKGSELKLTFDEAAHDTDEMFSAGRIFCTAAYLPVKEATTADLLADNRKFRNFVRRFVDAVQYKKSIRW